MVRVKNFFKLKHLFINKIFKNSKYYLNMKGSIYKSSICEINI